MKAKKLFESPIGIACILLIIWLITPLIVRDSFYIDMLNVGMTKILVILGMVMLIGLAGQVSLGQNGFFAIGAYMTAYFTVKLGQSIWIGFFLSLVLTIFVAYLVGWGATRIRALYLAVATLAFGFIVWNLALAFPEYTGGSDGLQGVPSLSLGFYELSSDLSYFYFIGIVVITLSILLYNVAYRSSFGRLLKAIHEDELAASSLGVDVSRKKISVFIISAVLANISGFFYAHYRTGITPNAINLHTSIEYLMMLFLGGVNNIWGAFIGTQLFQIIPGLLSLFESYKTIIYGLIFIAILFFMPNGIASMIKPLNKHSSKNMIHSKNETNEKDFLSSLNLDILQHPAKIKPIDKTTSLLAVENVHKNFGGVIALEDISFNVYKGQIKGIIGPNGSGKSTLFNVLTGTIPMTKGKIFYHEENISGLHTFKRAQRGLKRTFQNLKIFNEITVLENMLIGLEAKRKNNWIDVLFHTNKLKKMDSELLSVAHMWLLKFGLFEEKDHKAGTLPYGKLKLLELARTVAELPEILCLDEPAAGLNEVERIRLKEIIREINNYGVTILIVEHDIQFVTDLSDEILVLVNGNKLMEGHPSSVFKDERVITAYIG